MNSYIGSLNMASVLAMHFLTCLIVVALSTRSYHDILSDAPHFGRLNSAAPRASLLGFVVCPVCTVSSLGFNGETIIDGLAKSGNIRVDEYFIARCKCLSPPHASNAGADPPNGAGAYSISDLPISPISSSLKNCSLEGWIEEWLPQFYAAIFGRSEQCLRGHIDTDLISDTLRSVQSSVALFSCSQDETHNCAGYNLSTEIERVFVDRFSGVELIVSQISWGSIEGDILRARQKHVQPAQFLGGAWTTSASGVNSAHVLPYSSVDFVDYGSFLCELNRGFALHLDLLIGVIGVEGRFVPDKLNRCHNAGMKSKFLSIESIAVPYMPSVRKHSRVADGDGSSEMNCARSLSYSLFSSEIGSACNSIIKIALGSCVLPGGSVGAIRIGLFPSLWSTVKVGRRTVSAYCVSALSTKLNLLPVPSQDLTGTGLFSSEFNGGSNYYGATPESNCGGLHYMSNLIESRVEMSLRAPLLENCLRPACESALLSKVNSQRRYCCNFASWLNTTAADLSTNSHIWCDVNIGRSRHSFEDQARTIVVKQLFIESQGTKITRIYCNEDTIPRECPLGPPSIVHSVATSADDSSPKLSPFPKEILSWQIGVLAPCVSGFTGLPSNREQVPDKHAATDYGPFAGEHVVGLPIEAPARPAFKVSRSNNDGYCFSRPTSMVYPTYRRVIDCSTSNSCCQDIVLPLGGDAAGLVLCTDLHHHAFASCSARSNPNVDYAALSYSGCNRSFFRDNQCNLDRRKAYSCVVTASGQLTDKIIEGGILLFVHDGCCSELTLPIVSDVRFPYESRLIVLCCVTMLCEAWSEVLFKEGTTHVISMDLYHLQHEQYDKCAQSKLKPKCILRADVLVIICCVATSKGNVVQLKADCFAHAASWSMRHEHDGFKPRGRLALLFDSGALFEVVHGRVAMYTDTSCKYLSCELFCDICDIDIIGNSEQFSDATPWKGQSTLCTVCGLSVDDHQVISFVGQLSKSSAYFCYTLIQKYRPGRIGEFDGTAVEALKEGDSSMSRPGELGLSIQRGCYEHLFIRSTVQLLLCPNLCGLVEKRYCMTTRKANTMLLSAQLYSTNFMWSAVFSHNANMLKYFVHIRGHSPSTLRHKLWNGPHLRSIWLRTFWCSLFELLLRTSEQSQKFARTRLIYVGETGAIVGWQVLNTSTSAFQFNSKVGKIFDKDSVIARGNHLHIYITRRESAKKGIFYHLDLSIQSDDFAPTEKLMITNDALCQVFSSFEPTPASTPLESRGRVDCEDEVFSKYCGHAAGERPLQQSSAGSGPVFIGDSSKPAISYSQLLPETSTLIPLAKRRGHYYCCAHSEPNRIEPLSESFWLVYSSNSSSPFHNSARSMGNGAELSEQIVLWTHKHTAPKLTSEDDEDVTALRDKPRCRSLRQGSAPEIIGGSDIDCIIGDCGPNTVGPADLDKYGTDRGDVDFIDDARKLVSDPSYCYAERKNCTISPQLLQHPLHALPVSKVDSDPPYLKIWWLCSIRHYLIMKLSSTSYCMLGSVTRKRYVQQMSSSDFTKIVEVSPSTRLPAVRAGERSITIKDFPNDALRGQIALLNCINYPSAHCVSFAKFVEPNCKTHFQALTSACDLKTAWSAAIRDQSAKVINVSIGEDANTSVHLIACSKPLIFYDRIRVLWEYRGALQLIVYDSALMKYASSLGSEPVHKTDLIVRSEPVNVYRGTTLSHCSARTQWRASSTKEVRPLKDRTTWKGIPPLTLCREVCVANQGLAHRKQLRRYRFVARVARFSF